MRLTSPRQTRKIRPTRRSVSGIYAFRGTTSIPYESTLERDFLIRTEFFGSVLDVIPQPVQIPFQGKNGLRYTYTPDFLVRFRASAKGSAPELKPLLVEVKPATAWREHWRDWAPKWKAARRYAIDRGWIFRIADESRIRDQVLANINFLDRYRRMSLPDDQGLALIDCARRSQATTVSDLAALCFGPSRRSQGIAHIWHLVAMRHLECQVEAQLTEQTTLWIPSHD
jgi:hypothetical protein